MNMMFHVRRLLLPVLVIAVGCASIGCNSRWFRRAVKAAGEEAAYAALETALVKAKVVSADHMERMRDSHLLRAREEHFPYF
jgi:hypothetical protein